MDKATATRTVILMKTGQETGSVSRHSGSGWGRATTVDEDRFDRLCAGCDRNVKAVKFHDTLQRTGNLVSDRTIWDRLHDDKQRSKMRVIRTNWKDLIVQTV